MKKSSFGMAILTSLLLTCAILLLFSSCAEEDRIDKRTSRADYAEIFHKIQWKVVGTAKISVTTTATTYGAVPVTTTTVTYTVPDAKQFDVDVTAMVPVLDENTETLGLGAITIDKIKVTNLDVCGVGEDEKCTLAATRMYTTDVSGHPGISGFVNIDKGYGVPLSAGEVTATESVGMAGAEALLDSYTIPAGDKKLTAGDFGTMTYVAQADMSNAGYGDYKVEITIDLVVGIE